MKIAASIDHHQKIELLENEIHIHLTDEPNYAYGYNNLMMPLFFLGLVQAYYTNDFDLS